MFVLPLLALTGAFLLPQDAPPAETSATVRAFLDRAQASFYSPEEDGLRSLSFSVPIEEDKANLQTMLGASGITLPEDAPDKIRMVTTTVTWESGGEPLIKSTIDENLPGTLEMMRPMLQSSGVQLGQQTLSAALNSLVDFKPLLESYVGRIDGNDGDDIKLVFERKADTPEETAPPETLTWLFNDDGLPVGTRMTIKQNGPMGAIDVNVNTRYTWRPARGDAGKVLLAEVESSNEMGSLGSIEQHTTYRYKELSGILVMVGYHESVRQNSPFMQMPENVRDVTFEGLAVNGEG